MRDDLGGVALRHDPAPLEEDRPVAELHDPVHVVGHEHDTLGALDQVEHALLRLRAERLVAGGEHLVEQQDVRVDRGGDREAQAGPHAGRIGLDRRVDERADVGELDDARRDLAHERRVEAEEGAGQADVVETG